MNIWAYTGGSGILGGNVMTPRAANAGAVSHDGVIVIESLAGDTGFQPGEEGE